MQDLNVEVRLNHVTSNVEPYHYSDLVITDKASGLTVAKVTLTPQHLYDILAGRGTYMLDTAAEVPSLEGFPRIGQELHTFSRLFQTSGKVHYYGRDARDVPEWVKWGEWMRDQLGAQSFNWSDRNNGKYITFQLYRTDIGEDALKVRQVILDEAQPPEGLE